jgi:tRNA threonylcarbamoyladenosine biosynthesis protein TsaB
MLAYVSGAAFIGFDSLEGWAREAPGDALHVHIVADAQRGDVYSVDLVRAGFGEPLQCPAPSRIEALPAWSGRLRAPGLVMGPGLLSPTIRSAIPEALDTLLLPADHPRAFSLLNLAQELCQAGRRDDLWTLEPTYLRRSAAEDLWETRP